MLAVINYSLLFFSLSIFFPVYFCFVLTYNTTIHKHIWICSFIYTWICSLTKTLFVCEKNGKETQKIDITGKVKWKTIEYSLSIKWQRKQWLIPHPIHSHWKELKELIIRRCEGIGISSNITHYLQMNWNWNLKLISFRKWITTTKYGLHPVN